ncbi:MAG TPA: efflux RND transporter periplasmic adaptor subunit [Gemmatimonadales bacterium]|nr:efflux RND transporter periplasmic adaptor subunit [Gemmatimonadales bacterium]
MDTRSADLSALKIDRTTRPDPPSRRFPRWLLIAGQALIVLVIGAWLISRSIGGAVPVRLVPAVLISPAQASSVVIASGYVVAQRKAAVASKGTGRLVYLGVVEGDRVKSGQVIARIEDADVRAQVAQAEANVRLGVADLQDAQRSMEREKQLLDSNLSTQAAYDAAEARYRRVTATIDVAKASLGAAQVALENTVIRAPFDGTVLTKNADVGEMVAPLAGSALSKAAVVTLADLGSLQVEVDVSETSIEQVIAGQPCEIVLDAYPDVRYPGTVAKIVPTADRAKATVQVKVAFNRYDGRVLPEMSAKVHFLPRADAAARSDTTPLLTVPGAAVALRGGHNVVYTVTAGHAVEVPVVVGRRVGQGVAILQGLAVGTQVVDSVSDGVQRGVKVKTP